jgi:uncharacterized protein YjbI with pentapeptide repeats
MPRTGDSQPRPLNLTPFDGTTLEGHHDYDGMLFADLDLAGQQALDARFVECRLERCNFDGAHLARVRLLDSVLAEIHGASLDLADSTWRGTTLETARLGAAILTGASWTDVRVTGCKLGFVNLADAHLDGVTFRACEIGALDLRLARAQSVSFADCTIDELNVSGASLAEVDLSGARLRSLVGVESLRGAIVGRDQLTDLAPLLASQLGITVRD